MIMLRFDYIFIFNNKYKNWQDRHTTYMLIQPNSVEKKGRTKSSTSFVFNQ